MFGTEKNGGTAVETDPRAGLRIDAPAVDIFEQEDGIRLFADLPGVATGAVRIDVNKGVLTIDATFAEAGGAPGEVEPREYHRAFELGPDLDASRISATLGDGVPELVLPDAE